MPTFDPYDTKNTMQKFVYKRAHKTPDIRFTNPRSSGVYYRMYGTASLPNGSTTPPPQDGPMAEHKWRRYRWQDGRNIRDYNGHGNRWTACCTPDIDPVQALALNIKGVRQVVASSCTHERDPNNSEPVAAAAATATATYTNDYTRCASATDVRSVTTCTVQTRDSAGIRIVWIYTFWPSIFHVPFFMHVAFQRDSFNQAHSTRHKMICDCLLNWLCGKLPDKKHHLLYSDPKDEIAKVISLNWYRKLCVVDTFELERYSHLPIKSEVHLVLRRLTVLVK